MPGSPPVLPDEIPEADLARWADLRRRLPPEAGVTRVAARIAPDGLPGDVLDRIADAVGDYILEGLL